MEYFQQLTLEMDNFIIKMICNLLLSKENYFLKTMMYFNLKMKESIIY